MSDDVHVLERDVVAQPQNLPSVVRRHAMVRHDHDVRPFQKPSWLETPQRAADKIGANRARERPANRGRLRGRRYRCPRNTA